MTDALLFLHVLSAFLLVGAVVMLSSIALGAAPSAGTVSLADRLWDVGGIGTLVFGIWLSFRDDQFDYEFFSFWIIAAIVLWLAATELGRRARAARTDDPPRFAQWHWLAAAVVALLLADMIFKPGA